MRFERCSRRDVSPEFDPKKITARNYVMACYSLSLTDDINAHRFETAVKRAGAAGISYYLAETNFIPGKSRVPGRNPL